MILHNKNNFLRPLAFCSLFLTSIVIFNSCKSDLKDNSDRFKKGVFEIPAGKGYSKTTVIRKDSLQIEQYEKIISITKNGTASEKRIKHIDTLYIKWKNNFFYTLNMKSPKKEIDKDPIYVQITEVTHDSYSFSAKIGFSNFKQNGTVYKVK